MFGRKPSWALNRPSTHSRARAHQAGAARRCVLAVGSLCAASTAFLLLGLFVASVWSRPPGNEVAGIILLLFLTLISGAQLGVRALKRAGEGATLYGGEGMAVAGIVLNSLPAFFVVIWVCIAVLPLHFESSLVSLRDGCSSLAQDVYHLAGKR
jgi:hypothetical protein